MKTNVTRYLAVAALLGVAACQDLEVTNQNLPNTERVLATPDAIEAVVRSSFNIWWTNLHGRGDVYNYFPDAADETSRSLIVRGFIPAAVPRVRMPNGAEDNPIWIPRATWDNFASGAANTNDALRVMLERNMRITVPDEDGGETIDRTDRTYAYARLWQGINLGYYAMSHDVAPIVREDDPVTNIDPAVWEVPRLKPYQEGMAIAINSIELAIERMETGDDWTTPVNFINGRQYNNQQLAQFAHTMIARLLIYNARTPEERAAVDWDKVLYHTERGLDFDLDVQLASGVITSAYLQRVGHVAGTNANTYRVGNHILGMADVSGRYQEWLATPLDDRDYFLIDSPDLRFQTPGGGVESADHDGAYFIFTTGVNTSVSAGTYLRSRYLYRKRTWAAMGNHTSGVANIATADENRLYRAEALYYLNRHQEAADLVNVSRTRGYTIRGVTYPTNLPPVTAAGVPQSADCVPRFRSGACGDLLHAIRYERAVEMYSHDAMRAWLDYRGFGMLAEGQAYHLPIPGRYLPQMRLEIYEFGGIGGPGAAGPPIV